MSVGKFGPRCLQFMKSIAVDAGEGCRLLQDCFELFLLAA